MQNCMEMRVVGNRDVDATDGWSLVDVVGLAVAFPIAALAATGCDSLSSRTDLQNLSLWAADTIVEAADRSFAEVDLDPDFGRGQRAYSATVGYGVQRVFILASSLDENASFQALAVKQDGTRKLLGSSSTAETFSFSADSIKINVVESADGERKTRTSIENQRTTQAVDGADLSGLLELDADSRWVLEPLAVGSNMLEIEATGQDGEPTRPYVINVVRSEPDLTDPGVRDRYFKDSLIQLDLEGVRRAVDAGSDINQPLEHGRGQLTPLMATIAEEHTDLARQLIDSGADPNLSLPEDADAVPAGTSPLLLALAQGQDALVPLLIERGADVDAIVPVPDPKTGPEGSIVFDPPFRWPSKLLLPGMTALLLAINNGKEQNIGLLLKAQADPNRPLPLVEPSGHSGTSGELSGASPIMLAMSKGHDDIVRQLIDHGADVNYAIPIRGGESGPDGTVIYKPPFREPSKVFVPGLTALLLAVIEKREESVRLLLEAAADPNKAFPLTVASVHDPAAEQVSGVSPIMLAMSKGHDDIVRQLIDHGADVNYAIPIRGGESGPDGTVIYKPPFREPSKVFVPGLTALLLAVIEKREESVRLLLEAAADPNKAFPLTVASVHDPAAEQVSGVSPLIAAAGIENTAIVRTLIEAGADVDYEVPEHPRTGGMYKNATTGVSALKVARARGNEEIIRVLEQAE